MLNSPAFWPVWACILIQIVAYAGMIGLIYLVAHRHSPRCLGCWQCRSSR